MAAFLLPVAGAALGLGAIDKLAFGGKLGISDAIGGAFDEFTGAGGSKREEEIAKLRITSEANARADNLRMTIEDRKAAREEKADEAKAAREAILEDRKAQREADDRRDTLAREERAFLATTASAKEAKDAMITAAAQSRQDQLKRDELNAKIVSESRAAALDRFRATKVDFPKLRAIPDLDEDEPPPKSKRSAASQVPQALFSGLGDVSEELAVGGLLGAGKILFDKYRAFKGGKMGKVGALGHASKFDDAESIAQAMRAKKIVQESQETTNTLHPTGGYRNIPVAQHVTQDPGFTMKMPRVRAILN